MKHITTYLLTNGSQIEVEFYKEEGDFQPVGEYKPTALDAEKKQVDFLLMQVGPNVIQWQDGRREMVTPSKLAKLQKNFSWRTDF